MRRGVGVVVALLAVAGGAGCGAPSVGVVDASAVPAPTVTVAAPVGVVKGAVAPPDASAAVDLAGLPVADPWAVLPAAPVDDDQGTMPTGELVAPVAAEGAALFDAPAGDPFAVLPKQAYRGDTWYPVVAHRGDWYQVLLVVRRGLPSAVGRDGVNGATGWVRAGDVVVGSTDYAIRASLSAGTVELLRGGEVVASSVAAHGTSRTPTPLTRTFVMSIAPQTGVTYSRTFVYLGAHSPTLDSFDGGPAPIAIHAYPTYSGAISNGCLRIPADSLDTFAAVPLGTPVLIVE